MYLNHPLSLFSSPSTSNTASSPFWPLGNHAIYWSLRMVLVVIDAHVWFVHSSETSEIIIELIWQLIFTTSSWNKWWFMSGVRGNMEETSIKHWFLIAFRCNKQLSCLYTWVQWTTNMPCMCSKKRHHALLDCLEQRKNKVVRASTLCEWRWWDEQRDWHNSV